MHRRWQRFYDPQVPKSIPYPDLNLYQMFQQAVARQPRATATLFFGARLSYRRLSRLVDRLAAALHHLEVKKGDRVALILPNLPGYPVAHLATLKLGGILVPTNPLYVERELQFQLNDAGAETAVVLDQLYPRLAAVRETTRLKRVIVMSVRDFLPPLLRLLYPLKHRSPLPSSLPPQVFRYSTLMGKRFAPAPEVEVKGEDIALFLYTGGTTGVSKGAVLTHRNLVVNAHQTRAWLWSMEDGREVILCVLPFFHSYGLTTGLHLALLSRSTMLLVPRFELSELLPQIKKYRPTVFCAVPSLYNAIARYPGLKPEDVSSIRLCISGGAALPAEVQRRFEELTGGKLVEGYGLSEASPVTHVNPTHGHRKPGTIGIPVPDTDAEIRDPQTQAPLPVGEVGELAVRGPQVMQGYWNRPEETRQVLHDGWLLTGDMASCDEDGFFRIVDRKKDVIISAGMNIYPREVEEVLHRHPKIVEAAVLGIPSRVREEIPKAFIVVEAGQTLSRDEVIEFLQGKLAKYKIPKRIEFVSELPKSAAGKVLKRVLKEQGGS